MKICPDCNHDVGDARFCPNCGKKLEDAAPKVNLSKNVPAAEAPAEQKAPEEPKPAAPVPEAPKAPEAPVIPVVPVVVQTRVTPSESAPRRPETDEERGVGAYKPVSAWGYVGYGLLFAIPVIGQIMLIVFTFSKKNLNRRGYARSFWCWMLIDMIIAAIGGGSLGNLLRQWTGSIQKSTTSISRTVSTVSTKATKAPSKATEAPAKATEAPKPTATPKTESKKSNGVTPEFKEAMDSYEKFFDEYAAFMKSYDATDLTAMTKYLSMLKQYEDTMTKLDEINEDSLSDADLKYYTQVMARINKKLLSVAD